MRLFIVTIDKELILNKYTEIIADNWLHYIVQYMQVKNNKSFEIGFLKELQQVTCS